MYVREEVSIELLEVVWLSFIDLIILEDVSTHIRAPH
jgi:hypothetical protein